MKDNIIKESLTLVRKPGRYIGGEVNSITKDEAGRELAIALAFPDVYEVGTSNLGLQILYAILNDLDGVACERVFAPWGDMEELLREKREKLTTLESGIALDELDVLGFTLQYELLYTNVVNMLELGGISIYASERGESEPIVIGGGPAMCNPEPVADIFDAFLIGDGEKAVEDIANVLKEAKAKGLKRDERIKALSGIDGMYVPSYFTVTYNEDDTVKEVKGDVAQVKKRLEPSLEDLPAPTKPVVPFVEAVHDRFAVEIARGCVRGCRFCQAGMTYRPLRERDPATVLKTIREGLRNTGYDDVSLLSL
ncbi:MAG: B12-binding domain-containing radical SAM protein, partial [Deltaproteobacteria bacterium]|nr:B12-binding domain-containing radical SAM protein [Deltaproteobacteria bacterium]